MGTGVSLGRGEATVEILSESPEAARAAASFADIRGFVLIIVGFAV